MNRLTRMITGFFLEIETFALCFLEKSLFLLMVCLFLQSNSHCSFLFLMRKAHKMTLIKFGSLNVSLSWFCMINNEQSKSFEIGFQQIILYCGLFGLFKASI